MKDLRVWKPLSEPIRDFRVWKTLPKHLRYCRAVGKSRRNPRRFQGVYCMTIERVWSLGFQISVFEPRVFTEAPGFEFLVSGFGYPTPHLPWGVG